ncbi:hypothetical protein [Cupriavidus sp. UYPR2.512]|uniref:hypothetical protein n=1 Tax=Cupriavidus sp. UYPR2.512 TaxID=1080187 RepID=UPI00037CBCCB|nr:hypothetical protein [Cupriavidus sp. UYPR2.512]
MMRIGTSTPTVAVQANMAKESSSQVAVARFAVLYRGTITFSYARTQEASTRGSLLARKLAALNERKRHVLRRAGRRWPIVITDNDANESASDGVGIDRATRDGGERGSGGQQHDGRDGDERSPRAELHMRSEKKGITPPARGVLHKCLAAQALGAGLSETLPRLWCEALLALRDEASAYPGALIDSRIHELFFELMVIQQQRDAPAGASMSAWRQRLIIASAARQTVSSGAPAKDEGSSGSLCRAERLNLLMPLLLLMYSKPFTPSLRAHAMNVRTLQRAANP